MRRTLATLMLLLTVALGAFAQDAGVVASYDAEQGRTFVPNPPAMGPFPACDTVLNYGTIPAYPAGVFGHGSATLGDTLYMVGGSSTGAASNVFARYHIPSGTWAPAGVFPESKTGGDLVKCGNALYYIGGGSALTTPTATCYRYTPAGGWTPIANIPTLVTGHVSEAWGDSVIFTVGGGWSSYITTVQVYRPASNTWSTSTPLPAGAGRRSFAGGLDGNRIYVAGGFSGAYRSDFRIGRIVRADSIEWTSGPNIPMRASAVGTSRPGGHAVNGKFYVITGEVQVPVSTAMDSIFIWDITLSAWQPTPVTGRGALTASNYWSVVSSSNIGGQLVIWFPGGALGTAVPGLMALRTCPTVAPPDTGWRVQTSGVTTALYAVKAVTRDIAWAGGAGGAVLRTTNSGTTWTRVGTLGADIYGVTALDENTAFVITAPSSTYIIRTTNGGTRWDTVFTQASPGFLDGIEMVDAANGWAMGDPVGGKWTVLRTTNGGTTWARIATEPNQVGSEAGWNNSFEVIGTNLWFGTNSSKVYRSTDNGLTWTGAPAASTNTYDLGFANTQYGVAAGTGGLVTTDGGATWTASTIPGSGNINGIAASSINEYWAARAGLIYRTANLGGSWATSYTGTGTYYHLDFWSGGGLTRGWAVNSAGAIVAFYGPVSTQLPNDIGVAALQQATAAAADAPARVPEPGSPAFADVAEPPEGAVTLAPGGEVTFGVMADTVRFRALVRNYGSNQQNTYQLRWSVDGVVQATLNNTAPLEVGDVDTITFQWNNAATGPHTARAWTILATDTNPSNDSASTNFTVGRQPGDTLYTFVVPGQIILGVAKMGPSNKLALTSGGQSSAVTTDNKWIVTTMNGTILDTTRLQINPTTGQGFGFRDLAWDGRWLLTSDNTQVRRIDTTTFTEIATRITGPGTLQRGIAADGRNRIWKSNFTTDPVVVFDSTGATVRNYGVPTVAPYGIALDKWTERNRMWLWYSEPSATGQPARLSKVDTATGAIVTTFTYPLEYGISGGLDIFTGHPAYPGRVIAALVTQNFPNSRCIMIDLGADVTAVGVEEQTPGAVPDAFALDQNYPNPFNPSTVIRYALPKESRVTLKVYDILGREVATLVDEVRPAGYHEALWSGRSGAGGQIASGLYFYRIDAKAADGSDAFTTVRKMLLVK